MVDNNTSENHNALLEMLNELKNKNYVLEFRREATCLYCFELQQWIVPKHFMVDAYYYFEETSNPDAERMLYAISLSGSLKGFLIDSCNVYTDNISQEMVEKLKMNELVNTNALTDIMGRVRQD